MAGIQEVFDLIPEGNFLTGRRVICILGHVDYGKTSIADCLLSLTGLVSAKATGQTLYLDDRTDEREKGITMKMSAFTLNVEQRATNSLTKNYMTVLDTPGHVDFSSEIMAAVKSCDGALIVVDIAEGVRPQTTEAVKIAVQQRLKMILVINKMDRAFLDMRLTHNELHPLITGIIATLNSIMTEECKLIDYSDKETYLDRTYFKADSSNVILASALDGWGVVAKELVTLFAGHRRNLRNETTASLMKKLMDPAYNADLNELIMISGVRERGEVCLYASLVLQSLSYVYKVLMLEADKYSNNQFYVNRLAQRFEIEMTPEMRGSDPRAQLKSILSSFAPLGNCIVNAMKDVVSDARQISRWRMRQLVNYDAYLRDCHTRMAIDSMILELELSKTHHGVNEDLSSNDSNMFPQLPIFAYVSKMIATDIDMIIPAGQCISITARALEEAQKSPKLRRDRKPQLTTIVYPKKGFGTRGPKQIACFSGNKSYTVDQLPPSDSIESPSVLHEIFKPSFTTTPNTTIDTDSDDSETDLMTPPQPPPLHDIITGKAVSTTLLHKATMKSRADRNSAAASDENLNASRDKVKRLKERYRKSKRELKELEEESHAQRDAAMTEEERMAELMAKLGLDQHKVIAITRVYYGVLEVGDELFFITSDYKPGLVDVDTLIGNRMTEGICKFKITALYILMGRNMIETERVSAGYICGVGGLDNVDVRRGTIVRHPNYFPVHEPPSFNAVIRTTITPVHPRDSAILQRALKWLSLTDSAVRVSIQVNREIIVHVTGDLHFSKLMEDLRMLADIPVEISKPHVWLRESVVAPISINHMEGYKIMQEKSAEAKIEQYCFEFSVFVVAIPDEASKVLAENYATLTAIEGFEPWGPLQMRAALERDATLQCGLQKDVQSLVMHMRLDNVHDLFLTAIRTAIDKHSHYTDPERRAVWQPYWYHNIWSVGKMTITEGTNVLINDVPSYERSIFRMLDETNRRSLVDACVVNAFDQVIQAGPICSEPMTRCAFVVQKLDVMPYEMWGSPADCNIALTRITAAIRVAMTKAFLKQQCRFFEPMLIAEIKIHTQILERIFSVIKRRRGTVTNSFGSDANEKSFQVASLIPLSESDGFANAIREASHDEAQSYLRFSHFEMIRGDPMYDASKKLGCDDDQQIENNMHAIALRDEIRKSKGLLVDVHALAAEKQRTAKQK